MKHLAKTLIASAVIAVSGAASAVSINSYAFDGSSVNIVFTGTPEDVLAGEIKISTDIGSFATYCIELTDALVVPSGSYSFGSYANDLISRLVAVSGFYGGSDQSSNAVDTTVEKTAFQLAVWEAVYDSAPGDLSAGTFSVTSASLAGVLAQANSYLAAADLLAPDSYATNNLYAFTSREGQDLVTSIPEPSTYVLMLAGLAGVGFVARRRS